MEGYQVSWINSILTMNIGLGIGSWGVLPTSYVPSLGSSLRLLSFSGCLEIDKEELSFFLDYKWAGLGCCQEGLKGS
jgi:hypothetical protein